MPLSIEELGLSRYATIRTVEGCGPIARGDGSVVTGRFTTSRVNVIVRLTIAGPDGSIEVLEGTTVHPIWSLDRNDWIQLSDLQEGERLQASSGIATVVSIAIVNTNVPVYNIEVHGEHVYQVGELGVLVHNDCISRIKESSLLVREAQRTGKRFQDSINDLFKKLWEGNTNPGIGTKPIGSGISEARSRDGARVYFRQLQNGVIEILGKSDKSNQATVIAEIIRVFG